MDWLLSAHHLCGFFKPRCAPSHTSEPCLDVLQARRSIPKVWLCVPQSCHWLSARVTRPGSLVCASPSPWGARLVTHHGLLCIHRVDAYARLHWFEMPRHTGTDRLNPVPIRSSRLDLPVPVTSGHRTGCPNGGHTVTVTSFGHCEQ